MSVSGTVADASTTELIADATVSVQGRSATTGADGFYMITGLVAGEADLVARHQGHETYERTVTLAGGTTVNIAMRPDPAAAFAGSWAGQWANGTFGTTGGATMDVWVDTIAQMFNATLDLDGLVFGLADPPTGTFGGSYSASGANVTLTSPALGNVTLAITEAGATSGSATDVPGGSVARVDFAGTVTASTIALDYTITFTAGGTAVGVLTLSKPS